MQKNTWSFRTYSEAMSERYGAKTYKLTISGGRSCPTRDGSFGPKKGWGGCSFCDIHGSASYFSNENKALNVTEQMNASINAIRSRFKAEKFIAYFQSYTTTHQEIAEFKKRWNEAILFPGVVALAIGTRPDCCPDAVLEVLYSLLDHVDVYLEFGVQSLHDETLEWFERGHDSQASLATIKRTLEFSQRAEKAGKKGRLDVSVHLILGAPTEPDAELIKSAQTLSQIGVHGIKFHHLHILKKTKLEKRLRDQEFALLTMNEYFQKLALFLRHLSPSIVVHRTHATAPQHEELIGPEWTKWKARPKQILEELMRKNDWKQGDLV